MSEQKYYVFQKSLVGKKIVSQLVRYKLMSEDAKFVSVSRNKSGRYENRFSEFTKSELGKIMGGVFYRTFIHQFNPELAEELYKLGYKTTQTTEEWIGARYEFDNIWEWINPLIELVKIEEE